MSIDFMELAVVETGGKQYKVSVGQKLKVEKLKAQKGDLLRLDKVLLVADGERIEIGAPYVPDAKVEVKVLSQGRYDKKIVFRYHPKTRYKKKKGHRQNFTELEILKL